MSKTVKSLITDELAERYQGVDSAFVVDMTGMNVQEQERLRSVLRAKSAEVHVVRNCLARRAFAGGPLDPLGRSLEGPCALVTSRESLVDAAKALMDAAKEFARLKLKQAIIEGDAELLTVEQLSKMKSRTELIGEAVRLVTSPGRALAGCLRSPQSRIAGCLKAMIDKAA